ncbi:MAG: hypothetical protein WC632_02465 [Candidatus Margulisiibacteriota bacterium]
MGDPAGKVPVNCIQSYVGLGSIRKGAPRNFVCDDVEQTSNAPRQGTTEKLDKSDSSDQVWAYNTTADEARISKAAKQECTTAIQMVESDEGLITSTTVSTCGSEKNKVVVDPLRAQELYTDAALKGNGRPATAGVIDPKREAKSNAALAQATVQLPKKPEDANHKPVKTSSGLASVGNLQGEEASAGKATVVHGPVANSTGPLVPETSHRSAIGEQQAAKNAHIVNTTK